MPGDIPVPRQDVPGTQRQPQTIHEPRGVAHQIDSQQNVQEEIPVSAQAEALERAPGMEQRLSVPGDIPVPRQGVPGTQRQPQTIHEPYGVSDQMGRQDSVQKIDEAPVPNATTPLLEETGFTGSTDVESYAGASQRSERAQAALRPNVPGARPEMVRDTEGDGTSIKHIQGNTGMQNERSAEHEAQGRDTSQGAGYQAKKIIDPRTPAFDGSQFLIPRADVESVPTNLGFGADDLIINAEAQTTSSLSELPDRMSMYVSNMDTSNGAGSISIQLEPKHLGKIKFKVSLKDNKVSAELSVSLPQTKEIIEAQLPGIRRSLVQHGMEIIELSVSLENGSLESDLRHSNLFRDHGNGSREINSSATHEQESERESSEQRDSRSNSLVDLLI